MNNEHGLMDGGDGNEDYFKSENKVYMGGKMWRDLKEDQMRKRKMRGKEDETGPRDLREHEKKRQKRI